MTTIFYLLYVLEKTKELSIFVVNPVEKQDEGGM